MPEYVDQPSEINGAIDPDTTQTALVHQPVPLTKLYQKLNQTQEPQEIILKTQSVDGNHAADTFEQGQDTKRTAFEAYANNNAAYRTASAAQGMSDIVERTFKPQKPSLVSPFDEFRDLERLGEPHLDKRSWGIFVQLRRRVARLYHPDIQNREVHLDDTEFKRRFSALMKIDQSTFTQRGLEHMQDAIALYVAGLKNRYANQDSLATLSGDEAKIARADLEFALELQTKYDTGTGRKKTFSSSTEQRQNYPSPEDLATQEPKYAGLAMQSVYTMVNTLGNTYQEYLFPEFADAIKQLQYLSALVQIGGIREIDFRKFNPNLTTLQHAAQARHAIELLLEQNLPLEQIFELTQSIAPSETEKPSADTISRVFHDLHTKLNSLLTHPQFEGIVEGYYLLTSTHSGLTEHASRLTIASSQIPPFGKLTLGDSKYPLDYHIPNDTDPPINTFTPAMRFIQESSSPGSGEVNWADYIQVNGKWYTRTATLNKHRGKYNEFENVEKLGYRRRYGVNQINRPSFMGINLQWDIAYILSTLDPSRKYPLITPQELDIARENFHELSEVDIIGLLKTLSDADKTR